MTQTTGQAIQVGSVVKLKSGSCALTVVGIEKELEGTTTVTVAWIDGDGAAHSAQYPERALNVEPES